MLNKLITQEQLDFANKVKEILHPEWQEFRLDPNDDEETCLISDSCEYMIWKDPDNQFILQKTTIHYGVRTMSNGDPGYPDEYDYVDVTSFVEFLNTLQKLFEHNAIDAIENTIMNVHLEIEHSKDQE